MPGGGSPTGGPSGTPRAPGGRSLWKPWTWFKKTEPTKDLMDMKKLSQHSAKSAEYTTKSYMDMHKMGKAMQAAPDAKEVSSTAKFSAKVVLPEPGLPCAKA